MAIAPTVAVFVITINWAGLLQLLEWSALDRFFLLRPQEPPDPRIAIVTIDEADIARAGQWPISDALLAQLLEKIKAQQPRAIGLDLYRNLPVAPGHQALVEVFESTPNLIGVEKKVGETVLPSPTLAKRDRVALADLVIDPDGKVRRGLLSIRTQDGQVQLSLAARLALIYLEAEGVTPQILDAQKQHLRIGRAVFVPFQSNDGGYVRANSGGYQILLNYRGTGAAFQTVSLTEVLEDRIPDRLGQDLFADRIVLIGSTGQSLNDLFFTPYSSTFLRSPERMAGVAIHANLTSQILSAALDGRALLRTMAEPVEWLWILGWSFVGAVGSRILPQTHPSKRAVSSRWLLLGTYTLTAGGVSIASSYLAFLNGWWIPVVAPLLSLTGAAIAIAAFQAIAERKRAETERLQFTEQLFQLNQANERFVPRQFLQLLGKESIVDVQVGEAVEKEMSILFADIRSFTTLSEQMTLAENFKFINAYLSRMEPAILENRGFIDKYIGDAIMALFNGSADDAVNAGLAMLRQLAEFNLTWQRCDRPQLRIGIGINTGSLMLGMVGGYNRMDSTVISDAVNLAYRLEGLTKQYGVSLLISQQTLVGLGDPTQYNLRFIDRVKVKGKSQDVAVFEVFDVDEPACKAGKLATKVQFEEGVFLYHQHLFEEAAQHFAAVLSRNPEDTVAQIYLERTRKTGEKGNGKD